MKKELFEKLVTSITQVDRIRKGVLAPGRIYKYRSVDVKRIRSGLHVSQSQFAMMIGVSKATLQNWEQGRRDPEGPAQALLRIVEKQPKAVLEALRAS
ncbi:MAG: NadS family protein [bacterium]|jgi:putative transcriptional regulator